jgi:hypothetical protein
MKKYKTREGDYLLTEEESSGNWRIWWYIAEWDDTGGCLGENSERSENPPSNKDEWEVWQAERCAEPLADGRDSSGFYFETKTKAMAALRAANEGLFSGEAPWPSWATQAKAAGWTPPKGWKP